MSSFSVNIKGRCNTVVVGDNVVVSQTFHGDGARVRQVVSIGMSPEQADAYVRRRELKRKLWNILLKLEREAAAIADSEFNRWWELREKIDLLWDKYNKL